MPRLMFGVPWGATVPPIVVPPPPPPFWTPVTGNTLHWQAVRGGRMPRFEHVFPQESGADQQFVKLTTPPTGTP